MPARSVEPTATFAAPGGDETALFIPSTPARGFDEELRRLLRSRLIVVHLLVLGYYALLAITLLSGPKEPSRSIDLRTWALIFGSAAPCLVGAVVLWRSP